MARVNVEEHAFSDRRLRRLAMVLGWDHRQALGLVVYLWHDSQELLRVEGTAREIGEWCWATSQEEGLRIVEALEDAGYISRSEHDGFFIIHGNEQQIENRVSYMAKAKKGGEATKKKWEELKKRRQGLKPSHRPSAKPAQEPSPSQAPEANSGAAEPTQCKAMQDNAVQGKVTCLHPADAPQIEIVSQKPTTKARPPGALVFEAYSGAYEARYGHPPVRNAKANALCKQLVDRLGLEDAARVVAFYLTHGGSFYVRTCHALGPCVQDAEGLRTQMLRGHRVTHAEAQQKDRQTGTLQAAANIARKLEAERGD